MSRPGIPSTVTKQLRRISRKLDRTQPGALRNAALARMAGGGGPRDMVLVCDGRVYTSEQQFAPLFRHSAALARRHGIAVRSLPLQRLMTEGPDAAGAPAFLGLMLPYDMPADREGEVVDRIITPLQSRGTRVILFDGDDDLGVLWGGCLAASDLCVKKHAHSDRGVYARRMIGKSNLTDHVARTFGWSFEDNIIPVSGGHSPMAADRIATGWNIALDDKIVDLARDMPPPPDSGRKTDILCRASVGPDVWTHPLRNGAVEALHALSDRFAIHAPTDRVPQEAYYREMLDAKISFSPFGFGEICWRDFEAILCGSLLMKPDMSHVDTAPDLFIPGETYVPIAWDHSDLERVAARYLADDAARRAITRRARQTLLEALRPGWFLDRFEEVVLRPLEAGRG